MPNTLPVSRQVKVAISLTPAGAQAQNLSTLLILGASAVLDTVERFRPYGTLTAVAADFGTSAPEYLAAALWFGQSPQPTTLQIGRWLQTAAAGTLRGATLSAAAQALANFTAVTSGGFTYTKDGGTATNVTAINLSGATNLNGVAALITAALTGATMVWNSVYARFELTSTLTGATSSISFLTAPGSGTNISALLGMTSGSSGAYRANGAIAESAVAAVALFDQNYGQSWYATMIAGTAADSDHLAIAAYLEATDTKHVYGVTTQAAACLVASDTTNIAYQFKQLAYKKTFTQYSSASPYAIASLLGRILTVDYTGNQTAITLAYKAEPGVLAEYISAPQADALKGFYCNALLAFNNNTVIILNGQAASGDFIDTVTGTDALAVDLQQSGYNTLYMTPTKVSQTDAGMHLFTTGFNKVCKRYVDNGLGAPGVWNGQSFGILQQGDFLPTGYYVYAPPVRLQNTTDRAARKSVPFQIAFKLAGAVHELSIAVTVNQ